MRTPHTHTLSLSRWLHTGNKLHFPQHQKIWQKCDSAFCLTLGTLHTSSRPLFNTRSLVFSLQIQDSRQNHMETNLAFFYCPRENLSFVRMRSTAPSRCRWYRENSKIIDGFPTPLVKTGYAKQQVNNTTTVARSLCRYAGKFFVHCEFARYKYSLNMLCSNWDNL